MMARAAGFHAGFALVATQRNLDTNPKTHQLLGLIKLWQEANSNRLFTARQILRLKNPENDFHLEKDDTGWKLFSFHKHTFEQVKQVLQPGQPTSSEWTVENTDASQPLIFVLTALGNDGSISKPWIELGGYYKLEFPTDLAAGHSIVCDGEKLKLYNEKGNFEKEFPLSEKVASVAAGKNTLKFDCEFPNNEALKVRLVVKCIGRPELIAREGN